jgi:hypothetical protein
MDLAQDIYTKKVLPSLDAVTKEGSFIVDWIDGIVLYELCRILSGEGIHWEVTHAYREASSGDCLVKTTVINTRLANTV